MNDKWTRYGLLVGIVVLLVLFSMVGTSSAYSDNGTYFTCYNCSDCTDALNNNTYNEVRLGADIINHSGTCINKPTNFQNKIFDGWNHTINGSGTGTGIHSNKNNVTIKNFIITDFGEGIRIDGDYGTVINNSLYSQVFFYTDVKNSTIRDNTFYGVKLYFRTDTGPSSNTTIENNNFDGLGALIEFKYGIHEKLTISNNNFTNNTANGIWVEETNHTTISNNFFNLSSIRVQESNHVLIEDNNLTHGSMIYILGDTNDSMISNNVMVNCGINSIYVDYYYGTGDIGNITISGNRIEKSPDTIFGIHLRASNDITFNNIRILNNTLSNISTTSGYMIYAIGIINNLLIDGNTIIPPYFAGIDIRSDCVNTTITNNTVSGSAHGGVYIYGNGGTVQSNDIFNLDFGTGPPSGRNYLVRDNNLGNIELKGGINNTIIYNNITSCCWGWVGTYCNNDAYGNNISYNSFTGDGSIQVVGKWRFYNNTISHNTFNTTHDYAIFLNNSDNNTIESNNVTNSTGYAFNFTINTSNNKGCKNIGSMYDLGTNYVYNTTQGCPPCVPINLLYTIGNFWVNYTYEIEPCYPFANIDTFNVSINEIWTNGSIDLFKNTSTIPHGWVNITIYSFNITEGRLSVSSISD